jgi:hypothetical protein
VSIQKENMNYECVCAVVLMNETKYLFYIFRPHEFSEYTRLESSTLKMEAAFSFETLVPIYKITCRHIP